MDDSDGSTSNAVTLNFNWTIVNLEDLIVIDTIPDQDNNTGDVLDGSLVVNANGGDGNLSYSAIGLPNGISIDPVSGTISGTIASGAETNSPYSITVTVDDGDGSPNNAVTSSFIWTVVNPSTSSPIIRVNTGGTLFTATDSNVDWEDNSNSGAVSGSSYSVNTGNTSSYNTDTTIRDASIPDYIDNTTFNALFANERYLKWWENPQMEFSFEVPNGQYTVNLYMCNSFGGTSNPGDRVFDIAIEDDIVKSNLDLVNEFGHRVAGMLSFTANVNDGILNIDFLYGTDNPLVNAIEIRAINNTNSSGKSNNSKENNTQNITLSIPDSNFISDNLNFTLFPNPATYQTHIKVSDKNINLLSKINIYDTSGRLIMTYDAKKISSENGIYKINVSRLQEGTYLVNLITDKKAILSHKKLIIKKN